MEISTERSLVRDSPVSTIIQTPVVQFENINILAVISVSSVATGLLLLLCTVIFVVQEVAREVSEFHTTKEKVFTKTNFFSCGRSVLLFILYS